MEMRVCHGLMTHPHSYLLVAEFNFRDLSLKDN